MFGMLKQSNDAILIFDKLENDGMEISDKFCENLTCCSLYLRACIETKQFDKGDTIIEKTKMLSDLTSNAKNKDNIDLLNTMIDFYHKRGDFNSATKIFIAIPNEK